MVPIYPSEELAMLTAALITDGHIDWNDYDGTPRPKKFILYSNNPDECQWFLDLVWRLFKVNGNVVEYRSRCGFSRKDSYKAVVHCAQLARLLIGIGIPCGDKTMRPYLVPSWIRQGDQGIQKAFLRTLFTFDGSITSKKSKKCYFEINFVMNKHLGLLENGKEYFQQIRDMLSVFSVKANEIHTRRCKGEKYTLMLFITNRPSILKFQRYIGLLSREKSRKLDSAVEKIKVYGKIGGYSELLSSLKGYLGSDHEAVRHINRVSKLRYTCRQFEHMRRGESLATFDIINAAERILGKKESDPLSILIDQESR